MLYHRGRERRRRAYRGSLASYRSGFKKEEKKRILECCVLRVCVDAGEYLFVPPTTKKLHIEQFDRGYRIGRMR